MKIHQEKYCVTPVKASLGEEDGARAFLPSGPFHQYEP